MRTSKDTTSMQQLRNVSKQRKGHMLNGNEDLELEDFSRQRRIFLPASNRPLTPIQEQTSSIETDEDTPLLSSHACSSVFHFQTAQTHDDPSACYKPRLGYTDKRNNLQGLPDDGQLKTFNEEEDYDIFCLQKSNRYSGCAVMQNEMRRDQPDTGRWRKTNVQDGDAKKAIKQ